MSCPCVSVVRADGRCLPCLCICPFGHFNGRGFLSVVITRVIYPAFIPDCRWFLIPNLQGLSPHLEV